MPAASARLTTSYAVARWCAGQGWPVHPLAPGRKTPVSNCPTCRAQRHDPKTCPCIPAGRPCHGFHAATTNQRYIDAWWSDSPTSGVGIACGPANLVVIDVDAHTAQVPARSRLLPGIPIHAEVNLDGLASGFDTLALLAALRRQPNPVEDDNTLRVRTPSGGLHIWYRNPDTDIRFRCSNGSSPKVALAWQVDVRAEGGYIVAPTTSTTAGTYTAEGSTRVPAPLPDWLWAELIRTGHVIAPATPKPSVAKAPVPRPRRKTSAAHRVLDPLIAVVAQCATTPEGAGFTEKLNRAAYTAGGLVAAGHLEEAAVRDLLLESAHQARPWQTTRNEKIVNDGLAAGAAHPFHLEGHS
ncbi:bifunctional DNA primase/polymerase [Streptomyces sp. V4I8]|uniref:bifunctional DNA primase/polymerase n=1 Tax=Streptomyces sp. V4I8 TaxID=3156469 RepID=UPI003518991C